MLRIGDVVTNLDPVLVLNLRSSSSSSSSSGCRCSIGKHLKQLITKTESSREKIVNELLALV